MAMNAGLILAGQTPNYLGTIQQANQAAAFQNQSQQANKLNAFNAENGAAVAAGDQNALAGYANIAGPEAALDVRRTQGGIAIDEVRLKSIKEDAARQTEKWAATKEATEVAAQKDKLKSALIRSYQAWEAGDEAGMNAIFTEFGVAPTTLRDYPAIAAETAGAVEAMESIGKVTGGFKPDPKDEYGRYAQEETAAGRQPLSRIDYAQAKKGQETVYGPDGNIILQRGGTTNGRAETPKLTESESKASTYYLRTTRSNEVLNELETEGLSFAQQAAERLPMGTGNYLRTPEFQKFDQARRDFINAVLRRESGAVISEEEFANGNLQYFPVPGDSPEVIEQKRRNRQTAIEGMRVGAGKGGSYIDGQEEAGLIPTGASQPGPTVEAAAALPNAQPQATPAPAADPQVPEGMFLNPETGQYTSRELLRNNMQPTAVDAIAAGGTQGMTMGFGDEIAGGIAGITGGPDAAKFATENARAFQEASREAYPKTYIGSEVVGAVATPAKAATTVKGAAGVGAAVGGAYAAGTAEGEVTDRLDDAARGAFAGGLFGAGGTIVFKGATKTWQKAFNKSVERPTTANLKFAKTAAYKAVDDAGEVFSPDDVDNLILDALTKLDDSNYVPTADTQTDAAIRLLGAQEGKSLTLGRLDSIRQNLWKRFSKADNEVELLDIIESIDNLIDSKTGSSELMKTARAANARFRKTEMLELAFDKADLQTASTGSGGNILNKYRQAVTSIVTNPRKAKWFSDEQLSVMRSFVEGDSAENVLRRVGKLAPGGNGLMSALNLYAAAIDPTMLAATATASAAKGAADRSVGQKAEGLLNMLATGKTPTAPKGANVSPAVRAGAIFSNSLGSE